MGSLWVVLVASLLACAVTTAGILAISRHARWGKEYASYFMSFAAGVLVSVSLMHIIPESFEMSRVAPMFLLVGFLGLYVSNQLVNLYVRRQHEGANYALGIIPALGIGFHSLVDGMIYSVTFNVSMFTGALAALGMVLHEFPEGIITFVLLQEGGISRRKAASFAFLAAAITTPLGAVISFPFIKKVKGDTLGVLLAVSAGALVYVGATHLLPAVERENKPYSFLALMAGVLVAVIIILSKGA